MNRFSPIGGGAVGITAIGSVLKVCEGCAPAALPCDGIVGIIPLSPVGELGATIGDIEVGIDVEDAEVVSCASFSGSRAGADAAKGDAGAGAATAAPGITGAEELTEVAGLEAAGR